MAKKLQTSTKHISSPKPAFITPAVLKTNNKQQLYTNVALVFLAVLTFVAYKAVLVHTFVDWDDQTYMTQNEIVQQPSIGQLHKIFSTSVALNYHPFTMLSLMLNSLLFGKGATSFATTNVLIHIINVFLVFIIAKKLSVNNFFVAFATALFFAIHPMRVESVAWISERKDVLYTCFFLLGMLVYLIFLQENKKKYLYFSLAFFVASCLSKAQAVVFPLVLLLLDFWYDRTMLSKKIWGEKLPFFAVSLLFGIIALNVQAGGNFFGLIPPMLHDSKAIDLNFNLLDRYKMGTYGFMTYITRVFYPINLSPLYPFEVDQNGKNPVSYYLGMFIFPIVLGVVIWSAKRTKLLFFGIGFYFVTVLLVLQFLSVGVAVMADRYTYLPYFGLFFMLAMLVHKFLEAQPNLKYTVWGLGLAFAGWLFYLTTKQVGIWKNTETLFSRRIELLPNDTRALIVRGNYYGDNGNIDAAIADLQKCVDLGEKNSFILDKLGTAYGIKGNITKALEMFDRAIASDPNNANAQFNKAMGIYSTQPLVAIHHFKKALQFANAEKAIQIKNYLALCYINTQNYPEALQITNEIVTQNPSDATAILYRGFAKINIGDRVGAITDLRKAHQLNPQNIQAQQQLKALGVNL